MYGSGIYLQIILTYEQDDGGERDFGTEKICFLCYSWHCFMWDINILADMQLHSYPYK